MSRRYLSAFLLCGLVGRVAGATETVQGPIGPETRQLVVVKTANWYTPSGTLERFERPSGGQWSRLPSPIPVNLGRAGMGWGRGLHPEGQGGPSKREGDGRSPAGVFPLTLVFGRADSLPEGSHGMPHLMSTPTTYCVEDGRSEYYNQIIDSREHPPATWQKWSSLRRPDGLFDWAIVVGQNAPKTVAYQGSCVFLHIWRGLKVPTSGCTSMARAEVAELATWLAPAATPLLVQLPRPIYEKLKDSWSLP